MIERVPKYIIYNLSDVILGTEISFKNAVTFVLVKVDTKFSAEFLETTYLTTLLMFNIFLRI